MKPILVVLFLSVCAYAQTAPYKTLSCKASDKTMFGDLTLVLNTKPEAPTSTDFPPVNGSVDMFLTLDNASKKMDTRCSAEPGNETNIVCAVIGEEAPLGLLLGDLNDPTKFTFTQDPTSGALYEYTCKEYPETFTCKPSESNGMFGDATLTVNSEPVVVTSKPTETNASLDIFLTLDGKNSTLGTYCMLNPSDKEQMACMAMRKEGDKEIPTLGFIFNPKTLEAFAIAGETAIYPYTCERAKKADKKDSKEGLPK